MSEKERMIINPAAQFAVDTLKQYALEAGTMRRGTSDLSPLESWLILRLYNQTKGCILCTKPEAT